MGESAMKSETDVGSPIAFDFQVSREVRLLPSLLRVSSCVCVFWAAGIMAVFLMAKSCLAAGRSSCVVCCHGNMDMTTESAPSLLLSF